MNLHGSLWSVARCFFRWDRCSKTLYHLSQSGGADGTMNDCDEFPSAVLRTKLYSDEGTLFTAQGIDFDFPTDGLARLMVRTN